MYVRRATTTMFFTENSIRLSQECVSGAVKITRFHCRVTNDLGGLGFLFDAWTSEPRV